MSTATVAPHAVAPSRAGHFELLVWLGLLQAFAPISIDMYLPAMPQMEKVFHTTAASVQLTMVTFLIGYALGQALYGPITDRFGRKIPLYTSLALFVASSIGCLLSPTIEWMAVFRLFQAIGACGGSVISRAMVRDLFPPSELRRIFSMLILVLGVSPIIAPLIGSYLLLWFGWTSSFYWQVLVGTVCLLGVWLRMPESLAVEARVPLNVASMKSAYSRLYKDKVFVGASFVGGFGAAGMFAYITSAPFVFMNVSTQTFGWLFGGVAAGMVAASQINGRMSNSVPVWKVLRAANIAQVVAGLILLGCVLTGFGGVVGVAIGVFLFVSAQGFVFPNGSAIAMMRHGDIAGTASAVLGTNQFLIAAVTTAMLGFVKNPAIPMAVVIAVCSAIALGINYATLGPKLDRPA
jgi:MFS transporter, DHA1 family, multidrug resistance protein